MRLADAEIGGGDHRHQGQVGHDHDLVAARAAHHPGLVAAEGLQPDQIAVVGVGPGLGVRRRGGRDIGRRQQLPAVPAALVKVELAQFQQVAAAQAQPAAALGQAQGRDLPFGFLDPHRAEQDLVGEGGQGLPTAPWITAPRVVTPAVQ